MIRPRIEDELCPRCGSTRPPRGTECANCGVVYAKYDAAVRKRQLATQPSPAAKHGPDWNRLPLYAGIAAVAVLLWNAGALWHRGLTEVDEATRINSPATGGAPLALLAFSCAAAANGMMMTRGEVQNRLQRTVALDADLAWTDRSRGIDTIRHLIAAVTPTALAPLAIGSFEMVLPGLPNAVADCHVATLAEHGRAPIPFDDVHD